VTFFCNDVRELDVVDQMSVDSCVRSVLEQYQRIDVLVNNAVSGRLGTLEQTSLEEGLRRWLVRGSFPLALGCSGAGYSEPEADPAELGELQQAASSNATMNASMSAALVSALTASINASARANENTAMDAVSLACSGNATSALGSSVQSAVNAATACDVTADVDDNLNGVIDSG
jgi:hypothetical protein